MDANMDRFSPEGLRREFEAIDTSGDGSLDVDELHALFKRLGKDVKRGTIANLVRLADEDGNGTIEWPEFAKIFEKASKVEQIRLPSPSKEKPPSRRTSKDT